MALVLLPCETPWWSVIQRKLTAIEATNELDKILEVMQRIHDLCNVSLDPDDDHLDSTVLDGLKDFILNDMDQSERDHFLNHTIKILCRYAKTLKQNKPPRGMEFSLQQNSDSVEFEYKFVASLLANAFFSTYPKRTKITHPTLVDFNFSYFFKELKQNVQKAKLRSFLHYFDWFDQWENVKSEKKLKFSRKVMAGKQWLTIEDWLECKVPLCSLDVKHDQCLENSAENVTQAIFSQPNIGQSALKDGANQESIQIMTHPELLIVLLYVEKIEDNEALLIENVRQISRIIDPKNKAVFEKFEVPKNKTLLCLDSENYVDFPPDQFEEDNFLRELNKCLIGFRQNMKSPPGKMISIHKEPKERGRLSPIGESPITPSASATIIVRKASATSTPNSISTNSEKTGENSGMNGIEKRRSWLNLPENIAQFQTNNNDAQNHLTVEQIQDSRRGRFIVLGSSGECLPINRPTTLQLNSVNQVNNKRNSFINRSGSSEEEDVFYSARNSINADSDEEEYEYYDHQRYSVELETPENRHRFAKALRDALKLENGYTESTDDGTNSLEDDYNVDISVTGSKVHDKNIRIRRGTNSCGFILEDEENIECMNDEDRELLKRLSNIERNRLRRNETNDSSKYSFDTDLSSELEEMYDQFAKWLNDPVDNKDRKLDARDIALVKYANSLLKRTLSESYAGKPESELPTLSPTEDSSKRNKLIATFRSLSLELAKHNNKIASQLKDSSETRQPTTTRLVPRKKKSIDLPQNPPKIIRKWSISTKMEENINCDVTIKMSQVTQRQIHGGLNRPIATGNWGCGSTGHGDVQLKLIIQWLAASMADVPLMIYHTSAHENLSKLDTLVRVLLDRKWTVGQLASSALFYAKEILNNPINYNKNSSFFFDKFIGLEKIN